MGITPKWTTQKTPSQKTGTNQNILLTLMLPSPMTGMMKWTVNGNHHKSTTQNTRVNGNQNKLITQTTKEHGYTQKSITQNTKKINLFTHTILSVELDLIYGKSSLEPSLTTFLSLMILKQLKHKERNYGKRHLKPKKMKEAQDEEEKKKADEEAKNSEPEDDEDDEEFDDEDEDDKEDADEAHDEL